MQSLEKIADEYVLYATERNHRKKYGSWFKQNSALTMQVNEIEQKLLEVKDLLNGLCMIKIEKTTMLIEGNLQQAVNKRHNMLQAIVLMNSLAESMSETYRKLRIRNAQLRQKYTKSDDKQVQLNCILGFSKTWIESIDYLCLTDDDMYPLTVYQLINAASIIEDTNALPLKALLSEVGLIEVSSQELLGARKQIIKYLPTLIISQNSRHVVVNLYEVVLEPQGLANLLLLDKPPEPPSQPKPTDENAVPQNGLPPTQSTLFHPKKRGRIPLHVQFPEIVERTLDFVTQHSFSAQERRRTDTSNVSGVSLQAVRDHLLETVPGLKDKGISKSTVHYLFQARRKGTIHAKRFKGLVNARVPMKRNDIRKTHQDAHFCNSQVNYVMEFATKFPNDVHCLSCDDKNKLLVGESTPAVSRHMNIKAFFMEENAPVYFDHDFPLQNSKLIPSGYMFLEHNQTHDQTRPRSRSLTRQGLNRTTNARSSSCPPLSDCRDADISETDTSKYKWDKRGRLHYKWGRSGPSFVVNSASNFILLP